MKLQMLLEFEAAACRVRSVQMEACVQILLCNYTINTNIMAFNGHRYVTQCIQEILFFLNAV